MTGSRQMVKKILYYFITFAMGLQIASGVVWIVCNFTAVPAFAETGEYIEISSTFLLDEYTGILYPALLCMLRMIQRISGIPYQCLMYVLQLGAAYVSGRFLCDSFLPVGWERNNRRRKSVLGSLYVLTIPMVLQCHMSILPHSLVLSGLFWLAGMLVKVFTGKIIIDWRFFLNSSIIWVVTALFCPDYLYLTGVVAVSCLPIAVLCRKGHKKSSDYKILQKEIWIGLLMCVAAVAVIQGTNDVTQTPGSRGRIQKTVGSALLSRVVWPNFGQNYYFWSEEVKAIMSEEEAKVISRYVDNVTYVAGPLFEEAVGKEQANVLYWQMAKRCLGDRTRQVVTDTAKDFLQYACPPAAVWQNLKGKGIGKTGWNYEILKRHSPLWTKYYVNYSLYSWIVCIIVGMGILMRVYITWHSHRRKKAVICMSVLLIMGLLQAVWYTLSGSASMDYKNVLFLTVLWYLPIWMASWADEESII